MKEPFMELLMLHVQKHNFLWTGNINVERQLRLIFLS